VNPDLSPLARHASLLDGQRPDRLAEVHERIGVARRRRRWSAVGAVAAAAAAVGVVVAVATSVADPRGAEPVNQPDVGPPRPLVYAVGSTIHYGDRSIDVGEEVQFLTVTDDGVAFVSEPLRGQPGDKPLWFTDGSTVERIGTTYGSPARGYAVEAGDTGSLLVVRDSGEGGGRPYQVVIDTSTGYVTHRESAEYGGKDVVALSVYDERIYFIYIADTPCDLMGDRECLRYRSLVKYSVDGDDRELVPWARYDEDLRSRPRTIVGADRGTPPVPGSFALDDPVFERQGADVVARSHDGTRELTLSEARTGDPIHLRVPSEATTATIFEFSQWLDDDRLVLFAYTESEAGTELADEGDIFVCSLSTGTCRLELQGRPGTAYQLPGLD
jgi:hypothetical protein